MKALCITGADNATLAEVSAPFYRAGMHSPKPLQRESQIDFSRWHQMVSRTLAANQPMGKLWENLATDLVLANMESDCWGWYEAKSVDALNFWAELEPNIHFLLVCTRPDQELAQRISQTDAKAEAEQWLEDWYNRHQRMLNFYLKYPERCLLIDATDALRHLTGQLAIAHKHWQLPLNTDDLPVENEAKFERNNATNSDDTTSQQPGQIASLIIRELIKSSNKDIIGLFTELQAAQYPFPDDGSGQPASSQLMDWLKADIDAPALQGLLDDYKKLYGQANNSHKLLALQSEAADTKATLEHRIEQQTQTLEDVQQENELLLLQLHQVQEELEGTFLSKQNLAKQLQDAQQHQTRLEQSSQEQQKINQQLQQANQQLEKRLVEAKSNRDQQAQQQLEDAKQENELLLLQLHQVQEELEHYFLQHQKISKEKEQLATASRRLKQQLNQAELLAAEQPAGMLNKLRHKKNKARPKLKYDQVQLQHEQVNPDYEHLWLKLKNPSFGSQIADEWSFRLSCAGVRPGDFGSQPKLELPEQQEQEQLLQQWFAESESEHGRKLELRFAMPNALDGGVWKKLHEQDKQLIRSLLEQLPDMLEELKTQGRRLSRNWDDWHKLAADMQSILNTKGKK